MHRPNRRHDDRQSTNCADSRTTTAAITRRARPSCSSRPISGPEQVGRGGRRSSPRIAIPRRRPGQGPRSAAQTHDCLIITASPCESRQAAGSATASSRRVVKMGMQRLEATEAALRIGQCLKEEGQHRLDAARKLRHQRQEAGRNRRRPEGRPRKATSTCAMPWRILETKPNKSRRMPACRRRSGRMLYEAAWGIAHMLAEPEIEAARRRCSQEMIKKLNVLVVEVPAARAAARQIAAAAIRKSEAHGLYKTLIDQVGDIPLATEAVSKWRSCCPSATSMTRRSSC